MSILSLLADRPQDVVTVISFIGGLLGLRRHAKKRQAIAAEVSRWASTAAALVVGAIQHGLITDDDEAIRRGLARFKALASAAGVEITPAHEAKAVSMIAEAATAAAQVALKDAAQQLYRAADAAIKRLEAKAAKPTK
jgi:hypothetical protein